jgi:hypothetical protein
MTNRADAQKEAAMSCANNPKLIGAKLAQQVCANIKSRPSEKAWRKLRANALFLSARLGAMAHSWPLKTNPTSFVGEYRNEST